MDNFTGTIKFYKSLKYDYITTDHNSDGHLDNHKEYVFLGETQVVSVDLKTDTRAEEIELIEEEVAQRSIDHQVWLDTMSGKIQSLRAIECEA
jgi:hypothetical protein